MIKSKLAKGVVTAVVKRVPMNGKRIVFLASIHAKLHNHDENADVEVLQEFNSRHNLVENTNALKLPFFLAGVIWDDLALIKDQTQLLSKRIFDATPPWLRYANRDDMLCDIEALLKP